MRLRQLSDLIADVQKLADVENETALAPTVDITEWLNQGWTRIYGALCTTGENYYLTGPFQFTTVSGQDNYYTTAAANVPAGSNVLPTDMWRVKGVDTQIQQGRWLNCERFQFEQRNDYQSTDWTWPMQPLYDYQNSGAQASIRFMPPPNAATPMRLWYYPAAVRLVNNADTIDGGNGWELYAINWAAKRCAIKDENYELVATLDKDMADLMAQINREAASRNAGAAPMLRRVRYKRRGWMWPWRV